MSQQLLYVLMTGLDATTDQMTAATHNLANANTTGFKAQQPIFRALPLYGQGLANRVDAAAGEASSNFAGGPIQQTGRSLDVAVKGSGWIGVQASDGSAALTRNGALSISARGVLETNDGRPVLGRGGQPISLPPLQSVTIGDDGTVSGVPLGQDPDQIAALNQIQLSNPAAASLQRRPDGLFQSAAGTASGSSPVQLQIGALEGSNTDPVGLMVNMIEQTRAFQMQTELVHSAANLGQGQTSPLTLP